MHTAAAEKFPERVFEWAFALSSFTFPPLVLLPATEMVRGGVQARDSENTGAEAICSSC